MGVRLRSGGMGQPMALFAPHAYLVGISAI